MERPPFIGAINAVVWHSLACVSLTVILMMIIFTIISIIMGLLPSPQRPLPYKEIAATATKKLLPVPQPPGRHTRQTLEAAECEISSGFSDFHRPLVYLHAPPSAAYQWVICQWLEPFQQSATVRPEAGPTGRFPLKRLG